MAAGRAIRALVCLNLRTINCRKYGTRGEGRGRQFWDGLARRWVKDARPLGMRAAFPAGQVLPFANAASEWEWPGRTQSRSEGMPPPCSFAVVKYYSVANRLRSRL